MNTLLIFVLMAFSTLSLAQQKAFPTAEGYGQFSKGGRGGDVYVVSTLADSGSGSLRECLLASGPRTCVFTVSGDIVFNESVQVKNPYLTIAGQTSPGGINIKAGPNLKQTPIIILTGHVIIRHMRFHLGRGGISSTIGSANALDSLAAYFPAHNILIDHTSMSWGIDESINLYAPNSTVQWSMIYETLKNHSKGVNSWGAGQTWHHNFFAHNLLRNPNITGGSMDLVNNVMYNPGKRAGEYFNRRSKLSLNLINNFSVAGANTLPNNPAFDFFSGESTDLNPISFYSKGNLDWYRTSNQLADDYGLDPNDLRWMKDQPVNGGVSLAPSSYTDPKQGALDTLAFAGAIKPFRDSSDERVINDFRNCAGEAITDPSEVGGFPSYPNAPSPSDKDKDGMSDTWEEARGLNPNDPSDRNGDLDGDGYTNLEEYLNELAGDQTPDGTIITKVGQGSGQLPSTFTCGRKTKTAQPPTSPVSDLLVSGGGQGPAKHITVPRGTNVTFSWDVKSATRCSFYYFDSGNIRPPSAQVFKGSYSVKLNSPTSARLDCVNGQRLSFDGVSISFTDEPYKVDGQRNAPGASIQASKTVVSAGEQVNISWSTNDGDLCIPVHLPKDGVIPWSFNNATDGSEVTTVNFDADYIISCLSRNGQTEDFISITASGSNGNGGQPTPPPASFKDCQLNTQTLIKHGNSIKAYEEQSVAFGSKCLSEIRTCHDGVLSGSFNFKSCSVDSAPEPKDCTFNGQSVAHGDDIIAYQQESVTHGQQCISQSRTCNDGALSGSFTFESCTVDNAPAPKDCDFNGQIVKHGDDITAYEEESVAHGQQCVSQSRICTDGVLDGSYSFNSCSIESAPSEGSSLSLTATPLIVPKGGTTTIKWSAVGYDNCKASGTEAFRGNVGFNGSMEVVIKSSRYLKFRCSGPNGKREEKIKIDIKNKKKKKKKKKKKNKRG